MRIIKCPKGEGCETCSGVEEAIDVLRSGGLVVFPTDTVYGLAGVALAEGSVDKVLTAKGRPTNVPIPVAVPTFNDILLLSPLSKAELSILSMFDGDPITWVLPARSELPTRLLGEGKTIGVRVIGTGCAFQISLAVGPITATSANVHGGSPPRTMQEAKNSLGELVGIYMDTGETELGVPTTVIEPEFDKDATGRIASVRIIREGAVNGTLIKKRLQAMN